MSFLKKEYKYLLFILPAFLIYTIITVVPVFYTFFYSLTDFNGLSKDINFVGLENYIKVFTTSNIRISFLNSIIFGIATPVLVTAIAIPLAIVLNGKMKTKNIQRAIFFFPSVISALFLGYIWNFILSPSSMGLVNSVLTSLGKDKLLLLSDPKMAMLLTILVNVWCQVGWHACIYLANMQMIDKTYYEAASLDGATKMQQFWKITFPMLAPAMTSSVMLLLTSSLKAFDLPFALTSGGPGYATTMITQTIITEGVSANRVGFASAMSMLFLILIGIFTVIQNTVMRKREEALE